MYLRDCCQSGPVFSDSPRDVAMAISAGGGLKARRKTANSLPLPPRNERTNERPATGEKHLSIHLDRRLAAELPADEVGVVRRVDVVVAERLRHVLEHARHSASCPRRSTPACVMSSNTHATLRHLLEGARRPARLTASCPGTRRDGRA